MEAPGPLFQRYSPCSNLLPFSQFCFTPYRPAYAGPFIPGAHQPASQLLAYRQPCPVQGLAPPAAPVAQRANLCASGRSYNGLCWGGP